MWNQTSTVTSDVINWTWGSDNASMYYDEYSVLNTTNYPHVLKYDEYMESRTAIAMVTYIPPVLVLLGTFGNLLAFIVLLRRQMRRTSVYIYLASLAWADTGVLYLSAFKTWLRLITGFEFLHTSQAGCKILTFMFLVSLNMAQWLIVAISVDRLIAVLMPLRAATCCSPRRASNVSLFLLLLSACLNLHVFWKIRLQEVAVGHFQCAADGSDYFMTDVFPWVRLLGYSLVPFTIVFALNMVTICSLLRERPRRLTLGDNNPTRTLISQQNRLTAMLLCVSFTWLFLSAPFTIWRLIHHDLNASQHQRAKMFLARTTCFMLMYTNHSINFGLYCLTGKKFRRELVRMFKSVLGYPRRAGRQSTNTMRTLLGRTNCAVALEQLAMKYD